MSALRLILVCALLLTVAVILFGWTVQETRHQRQVLEEAFTNEAALLVNSLGPGLVAASNAARELDELVGWKLLDNARLIAALYSADPTSSEHLEQLLEANGLDSIVILDRRGEFVESFGEVLPQTLLDELAPILQGQAEELILGSTMRHDIQHVAAAAGLGAGGAVLVSVEATTARTFAQRLGVENLLRSLVGTGRVLYLSYKQNPEELMVEAGRRGQLVPPPGTGEGLRMIDGRAVFEVELPLESPAGSSATLRVGLDGTTLERAARSTVVRTLLMGLVLAALAILGTALALVSHLRSREREESAERLAEAEIARLRSERLAAAGALAAGLAHEVRSPMNAIGLAAQRLERKLPKGDERQDLAKRIGGEVDRLEGVLRGFLELAMPVSGERVTASMADLVGEVIDLLETEAREKEVSLEAIRGDGKASVDREAVRRSLINLIRNAIQVSPPDGRITVEIEQTRDSVVTTISDDGPGIDAGIADRIFDPFVTGRAAGTGLGLAMVRRVAEEHGGTISLQNRAGGGAQAVFSLPRQPGDRT